MCSSGAVGAKLEVFRAVCEAPAIAEAVPPATARGRQFLVSDLKEWMG
jgi:hypothetical protein